MSDIKQVIVMRTDLNMRKGKMIAQGGHAAVAFTIPILTGYWVPSHHAEWFATGMKKICVRCESEAELLEIEKQARAAGLTVNLITDAGDTEFAGQPTNTCMAIGPDHAELIDKITGTLKLL